MLVDRYVHLGEERLFLDKTVKISGLDRVSQELLQKSARADGQIQSVCYTPLTEEIKAQIKEVFSVDYSPNPEGYVIWVFGNEAVIYAETPTGAFYGALNLSRKCLQGIGCGMIYNYPCSDFRLLKLYLPSEENIDYFKKLIDFSAYYGYNKIMLEVGGAMEYHSHPEVNEGWIEYSRVASAHLNHKGDNPYFPFADEKTYYLKNSIHSENAGGGVLSQATVKELVRYCEERFMEVIPEMPSLSHSDYLLTRHKEFAERKDDLYPDTYCSAQPGVYQLLFDLLDEVIEVFQPKRLNIGHDEVFSLCLCELCKDKDPAVVFAEDIKKIHAFLKQRNVGTMIWAEELINCIDNTGVAWAGAYREIKHPKTGEITQIIKPIHPAIDMIPNDIELMHWYWSLEEDTEKEFKKRGFSVYFGNFEPLRVKNIVNRLSYGADGLGISNWSKVDEIHIQRNGVYYELAHTAMIQWNHTHYDENKRDENIQKTVSDLYRLRLDGAKHRAEFFHTFTKDIPFQWFIDGYEIARDEHIIGEYILTFSDGTTERTPMEYGKTIGYIGVDRNYGDSDWCNSYAPDNRLREPAYSCDYEFLGEEAYYWYGIGSETEIVDAKIDVKPEYQEYVVLKEIRIS